MDDLLFDTGDFTLETASDTSEVQNTQNPGSALGEAIGASLEMAARDFLEEIVKQYDCILISKGQKKPEKAKKVRKTIKKPKKEVNPKLYLFDDFGTAYNIDGVITNNVLQPLILLEYKWIRYKKHNRDKGSWLCQAHPAIRKRYTSIRSSIAILGGNWSGTSLAMIGSADINVFLIPFETVNGLLRDLGIKFDWGEKDRHIAKESWEKYCALSPEVKAEFADRIIEEIKPNLEDAIERILDDETPREVDRVTLELHTNVGEVKRFTFDSIESALDFLEDFSFEELFDTSHSITIFDKPKIEDDIVISSEPEEDEDNGDE